MRRLIPLFLLLFPLLSFATIIPIAERPISPLVIPPGSLPAADDPVVLWADYGFRAGLWQTFAVAGATQPVAPRKLWSGDVQWLATCRTSSGTLAAWQSGTQLMTAAVDDRGELLAPPRVIDGAGVTPQGIGWDGRRALLVSAGGMPTVAVYGTVLDAAGAPAAPTVIIQSDPQSSASTFFTNTVVVPADHTFVVFFREVLGSRVTDDGVLLDAAPKQIVARNLSINYFGAAYDGKQIAVVLHDGAGSQFAIRRVFVDPATLDVHELPSIATTHLWAAGVVWNGSEFVAYWLADAGDHGDLTTLRFTANEPATPAVVAQLAHDSRVSVTITAHDLRFFGSTFVPNGAAVVVTDRRGLNGSGPFPVVVEPRAQRFPALAPGLIVWGEGPLNSQRGSDVLWAVRTDSGGAPIGMPVPISGDSQASARAPQQAVFTGSIWFVVWTDIDPTTQTYLAKARRLGLDGQPLDAAPFTFATPTWPSTSIAFNGRTIVVVAVSSQSGLTAFSFDANGNALDPVVINVPAMLPQVASNGRGFLVVWNAGDNLFMDPTKTGYDVYAARLDENGAVIDTTSIPVTTRKLDEYGPRVASNGSDYLVTWTAGRSLIAQRVDANGTLDGAQQTIASDLYTDSITLAGDAGGYWAAWNSGQYEEPRLEMARLDAFGTPVDRGIITPMTDEIASILPGSNGAAVAYARLVAGIEAPRVFSTSVLSQPIRPHAARR